MEKVAKSTQGKIGRYHTIQEIHGIWQNQITQNHKNRQNLTKIFATAQAEEIGEILDIFKREDIFRGGGAIKNGKRGNTYAHRESGKPKSKGKYE